MEIKQIKLKGQSEAAYLEDKTARSDISTIKEIIGGECLDNSFSNIVDGLNSTKAKMNNITSEVKDLRNIKADISEIQRLDNAKATKIELNAVKSRVDELTTSSDATDVGVEVKDIRVGYDGVKYSNAGESVRQQMLNMNNALSSGLDYIISGLGSETEMSITLSNGSIAYDSEKVTGYGTQTAWRHTEIECMQNHMYKIELVLAPNTLTQILFVDENDYILDRKGVGTGEEKELTEYVYTPYTAKKLLIMSYFPDDSRRPLAVYEISTKGTMNIISNAVDSVAEIKEKVKAEDSFQVDIKTGSYEYNDTNVTGVNTKQTWRYCTIPCKDMVSFKVSVVLAPNTLKQAVFTNDSDVIISYDLVGTGTESEITKTVYVPDGATKLYIMSYYPDTARRMLSIRHSSIDNISTVINRHSETVDKVNNELIPKISEIEDKISNVSDMPKYYTGHMSNKIKEIRKNTKIIHGDSFAYFTDAHFEYNSLSSKYLLKEVLDKTSVNNVFCGGDFVVAYGDANSCENAGNTLQEYRKYLNNRLYTCHGNHDFTIKYTGTDNGMTLQKPYMYDYNVKSVENDVSGKVGELYFYLDNKAQKIRYIFIDDFGTNVGAEDEPFSIAGEGITQEQADWLVEALTSVENYKFVIFTHAPVDTSISGFSGQIELYRLFTALNNKNNLSYTSELGRPLTFNVDFTGTTNEIICVISGHNHADKSNVKDGLLSITTTSDAYYNDDPDVTTRTKGTVTESAIDVFSIDLDKRTIKAARIGAGNSREWSF